jgi:cysteine desulfuration protein SufE
MKMTLEQTRQYLDETAEILMSFPDRRAMLAVLVDMGKELPEFPDELKTSDHIVRGCASEVWVIVDSSDSQSVKITATAEAFIVKGFVKILLGALNGLSLKELHESRPIVEDFVEKTGLAKSMIATRANAFGNVYQAILARASKNSLYA